MSNTRLLRFKSFLTEHFTALAVEVFSEVENIVETCNEENKQLRRILHMALSPEIKLSRIDVSQYTEETADINRPVELNIRTDPEISISELPIERPKEEPIECEVNWDQSQQELWPSENNDNKVLDYEQNDPKDEEEKMTYIADSFNIQVIEYVQNSSATVSALEIKSEHGDSSSMSDEDESSSSVFHKDLTSDSKKRKKTCKSIVSEDRSPVDIAETEGSCVAGTALCMSKQFTVAHGVRSKSYKPVRGELPDPDVLKVSEVYKDFPPDIAPLITTMAISADTPLVDSAFGMVQEGSPISYQHPLPASRVILRHPDSPPPPALPLDGYRLEPSTCQFVCTQQQHIHLQSLLVTLDVARQIEVATRDQSNTVEWHRVRSQRITSSRFREICHVRGQSSAEKLADRIKRGGVQTSSMKRELEPGAIQEYCRCKNTNYWPCGFVIHPDAPWLGSSPDGLVFDPTENPPFGLLEIKCPNAKSYVDCSYLRMQDGSVKLKQSHSYYWQVQGQLLLTGMKWCDLVVFAKEDILIQRIYTDCEVARAIREKGDYFFFYFYMI